MEKSLNFILKNLTCMSILLFNALSTLGQIPSSLVSSYVDVDVTRSDYTYTTSQPTVLVDNLLGFEQDLTQNVSQYGGLLNTQQTATGYFYTKKINGRWWFVDPEGHLMLYIGINELRHDAADGFSPFSSASEWGNTVLTYFKDHGIYSGGGWSGRNAMNFSELMNFAETRNWLRDFYVSLGFAYPGDEKSIPLNPVFHPNWNTFVAQKVLELANEYAGDPRFIGIFSGNELRFDTDILTDCLNLNANDYNYQHAVQWVQNYRGDNDPVTTSNVTSTEKNEFFRHYIESYYKPIYDAIKLYASNHLCLGSRVYQTALMENKIFVETYAKYVDVMSFNRYSYWTEPRSLMDGVTEWADKPWIATEFYAKGSEFSYFDNEGGAGWIVPTQQERGYYYQNQTLTWLQHKSCAGWHWFRYRDENYTTGESASNKGLVDLYHNPYEAVMTQVKQLNRQYLKLAEYFDNESYAGINENTVFADFRADKTVINIGESITFTDQSTGSPNSWSWSFGGGTPSVSSSQNPTVTYNTPGTYTIKLTASNASGSDMVIKTEYITVNNVAKYYVSEDAYVRDGIYSNNNYGSEESLLIKEANANYKRISFLKFDISGLTDPIESVQLYFYGNGETNTGEVLLKKVSDDSWTENSITYNNKPVIGSDLEQKLISAATYYSIDITDYVLAEKAIDGVVSMAMLGNENSTINIWSKESTRKPFIKITVKETKTYVSDDAYVRDGIYSNNNYGSEGSLLIKEANANYKRLSFLKFDVSRLAEPIDSARLYFYGSGQTNTGDVLFSKVSDDSWSENSITFNNKPVIGSVFEQKEIVQTAKWYSIDITDYVLAEKAMDGVVSMAMLGNENSLITISSKESYLKPFIRTTLTDLKSAAITSAIDKEQPPVFSIYPNPTISKQVTVLIDNTALKSDLTIVDINGRTCLKLRLQDQSTRISLDKLNPGVYFLNLSTGTRVLCEKLIVQ